MASTIQSVERALRILTLFQETKREMGVSEIARELGDYKSTVHRTLNTLAQQGFVKKNPDNEKYWLGFMNYSIGMAYRDNSKFLDEVSAVANLLFEEFNEVVNVSDLIVDDDGSYKSRIIYHKTSTGRVLMANPLVGSLTDAHGSSVGKCLLAFSDEIDDDYFVTAKLKKYTANTIVDNDEFVKEINDIREKGYALDNEEVTMGLFCVGAPIFDIYGKVVAAMSVSGPTSRMKRIKLDSIVDSLLRATRKIKIID